jgi:hypothetical protein
VSALKQGPFEHLIQQWNCELRARYFNNLFFHSLVEIHNGLGFLGVPSRLLVDTSKKKFDPSVPRIRDFP